MPVSPIPAGYHSVTPYIIVKGAAQAIEFYQKAFNSKEKMRLPGPNGTVMHAEILIGDSHVMLADEFPDMDILGPQSRGGHTSSILIYVPNVDQQFAQAITAGAKEYKPIQDQFWGDRMGSLIDPFGHCWSLATHTEDVSDEEIGKRFAAMTSRPTDKC